MMLQMAISGLSLLSSRSAYWLNPLLLSTRRRCIRISRWRLCSSRVRFSAVAAASDNGDFTSPEIAKNFDFASEERIYNCYHLLGTKWEAQGYFKPHFDRRTDPFVVSIPPPNVIGSLHMGRAMFVTREVRWNHNEASQEARCLM